MSRDQNRYLSLKRKRVLCLDTGDQFLEKGDMVSYRALNEEAYQHYTLIGLIVGPGKYLRHSDYYYNKVTVLWENGGCGDVPPDHLTLVQEGGAERRSHPLPPLKSPRPDQVKSHRGPKTLKRSARRV